MISLIIITMVLISPLTYSQPVYSELTLTEDSIYRTESTELHIMLMNVGADPLEDINLQVDSSELNLQRDITVGDLDVGITWNRTLDIQTRSETPVGNHKIQIDIESEGSIVESTSTYLEVNERPLTTELTLKEEKTPREGNNTLTILVKNQADYGVNEIDIDPQFQRLEYLNPYEDCKRKIEYLGPGESYETICEFKATEDASKEYKLPIQISLTSQDGEKHQFTDYKVIPIESGIELPGIKTLVAGAIAIIAFLILIKKIA